MTLLASQPNYFDSTEAGAPSLNNVGQLLTGVTITAAIEPMNPNTGVPYFSIPALGWGTGWVPGNVLRFKPAACGAPVWEALTVLQGPRTVLNDRAVVAFRSDVDTP